MKIVIAGGDSKAEYIIKSYKSRKNQLVVINPNKAVVERLRTACQIKVFHGAPWSRLAFEQANAFDADIFIALCEEDTDNYAACLMAKRMFNAKKTICVVDNPSNVEYFKQLGLDAVISSTYLLAQNIMSESSMETLTKTLSLDDNRVTVIEKVILSKYAICNKAIKDIRFPKYASIAAIYRNYQIIIPNGLIVIQPKDTLLMVTTPNNSRNLLKYVETERASILPVGGLAGVKAKETSSSEKKAAPAEEKTVEKKAETAKTIVKTPTKKKN